MLRISLTAKSGILFLIGACALGFSERAEAQGKIISWGNNNSGQTNVPANVSNSVAVAAGANFVLALQPDGTVAGWGDNGIGQINVPAGLSNVVAVAAGGATSMALRSDGTIAAWGWNGYGQLNLPAGLSNVVGIAAGLQNCAALKTDGTVVAWGDGSNGGPGSSVPATLSNVVAITQSYHQNMALRVDGSVVVWGSDAGLNGVRNLTNAVGVAGTWATNLAVKSDGMLDAWGYGNPSADIPPGLTNVIAIAGGYNNFIALRRDGTVAVWGDNSAGQNTVPPGVTNVAAVAAGQNYFVTVSGTGKPQSVQPPLSGVALAQSTYLLTGSFFGQQPITYQWKFNGSNVPGATQPWLLLTNLQNSQAGAYSLLASNAAGFSNGPAATLGIVPGALVVGPTNQLLYFGDTLTVDTQGGGPWTYQWRFKGVALSGATSSALVLSNAVTNTAGAYSVVVSNAYGAVTNVAPVASVFNAAPFFVTPPTDTFGWVGDTVIYNGPANGSKPLAYQWFFNGAPLTNATSASLVLSNLGYANNGNYSLRVSNALGNISVTNLLLPVLCVRAWDFHQVLNVPLDLTNVSMVSAGGGHYVALRADGKVEAWGDNTYGQTNVPAGATNVTAVAAGFNHSLVLRSNGTVLSWGDLASVPSGLTNVIAVAAGNVHSLALHADGTVVAWGSASAGSETNVPAGLNNVVSIAAGNGFSAALQATGNVVAWGASPPMDGMTNIVAIAAVDNLLALTAQGTVIAPGVAWLDMDSFTNVVGVGGGNIFGLTLMSDATVQGSFFMWIPPIPAGLTNALMLTSSEGQAAVILNGGQPLPQTRLSAATLDANGFHFALPTQNGHVYALEYKNSILEATWTPLRLSAGNGGMLTVTDTNVVMAQRFYRVRKW